VVVCVCVCVCAQVLVLVLACVSVCVTDIGVLISSLLFVSFKAIFRIEYFPPAWTHPRFSHHETRELTGASLLLSSHKSA